MTEAMFINSHLLYYHTTIRSLCQGKYASVWHNMGFCECGCSGKVANENNSKSDVSGFQPNLTLCSSANLKTSGGSNRKSSVRGNMSISAYIDTVVCHYLPFWGTFPFTSVLGCVILCITMGNELTPTERNVWQNNVCI